MEKRPFGRHPYGLLLASLTVYVICYLESHRSPQTHDRT